MASLRPDARNPTADDDGKALVYNHAAGRMEFSEIGAEYDARNFGLSTGNTGSANDAAWDEMIADLDDAHPAPERVVIRFPYGTFAFATKRTISRPLNIVGVGTGEVESSTVTSAATVLSFPSGTTGIEIIGMNNTSGARRGSRAIIDGVHIKGGSSGTPPTAGSDHGVLSYGRVELRNAAITGFSGNGVRILGFAAAGPSGENINANFWTLRDVVVRYCGSDGIYTEGNDSNVGVGIRVDASVCGGWGIYDKSSLGNTWIGCHTRTNTTGPYKGASTVGYGVWLGCYSESDQDPSEFAPRDLVLGGDHGAGIGGTTSTALSINADSSGAYIQSYQWRSKGPTGDGDVRFSHGNPDAGRIQCRAAAGTYYAGFELFGDTTLQGSVLGGPVGLVAALPAGKQFRIASSAPTAFATFDLDTKSLTMTGPVRAGQYTTALRPSASTSGAGACIFDTTLNKPIWSTGSAWVLADGTAA